MSHKLTQKQLTAIDMLVRGDSAGSIAFSLGMRRETLSRSKQIPEFTNEIERVRNNMRARIDERLRQVLHKSIEAIHTEIGQSSCNSKRVDTALKLLKLFKVDEIFAQNAPQLSENAPNEKPVPNSA